MKEKHLGSVQLRPLVLPGGGSPFGGWNPVVVIRRALEKCPDEAPLTPAHRLAFVENQDFRNELERDLAAVESALINSEWKAATVIGGSLVEAMLLWVIQKRPPQEISRAASEAVQSNRLKKPPNADPERWYLSDYIEVAAELGIIGSHTETQARLVKDFRNLIHPGRTARTGQKCNAGTAHGAVAAIEFVIEDIQYQMSP